MQSRIPLPRLEIAPPLPADEHAGPTDPSHDARLRRGIIDTDVSRATAVSVTVSFLALVYGIPVSQAVLEKVKGDDVTLLDVFRHAPTRERLRQFEDDLEQASYAKESTQPRVQQWLTRFGRVGNKRAVVGFGGWLYYKPGIAFLGGPGFLDEGTVASREKAALDGGEPEIHADPRPAIFAFRDALARRNIQLILFPVPDKSMLQPVELHGRDRGEREIVVSRNVDWVRFAEEVRARGVPMFDPAPATLARGEAPRYLVQDTHWTPEWMDRVATDLARFVILTANLEPLDSPPVLASVAQPVERVGDIVDMLKLPEGQTLFLPQQVTTYRITDETGEPWEPDPKSDVLLLGDSFTNVFSLEEMGWGAAAGLAPHLARALGRGVDVIAQNDSGAFATRQSLARAIEAGDDRLAGKKAVIWEFASRELSVGDWKPIDWEAVLAKEGH
jgi:alginate O-acetyltransferase complex protein AlgJ